MEDTRRAVNGAMRLTLTMLGIGFAASLVVGLIIGAIVDDMALAIGRAVAIGMGLTAILTVFAVITRRSAPPTG